VTARSSATVVALLLQALLLFVTAQAQDSSRSVKRDSVPPPPDFETVTDRWRAIVPPPYELNVQGSLLDPYDQNILKGDYPIVGQNTFLVLTATAAASAAFGTSPTPSGNSARDAFSEPFFGRWQRLGGNASLLFSVELYQGDVSYRPRDWEVKATAVFNRNYVRLQEFNGVNINVRKGFERTDGHVAFQELFVEAHLADLSDRYDFISAKAGIQRFASDARGFVFGDENLGARIFGTAANNTVQYNLIVLPLLEKETNSELNTVFEDRGQTVAIATLELRDLLALGYTTQFSMHANSDRGTPHFNENGVPVRPALAGKARPHALRSYYLGWTGDGHLDWLNITHALYYSFGHDDENSVAGKPVDIGAWMGAAELSMDVDWLRWKCTALYASGDADPLDDKGGGFDAIVDEPFFAGGPFSYWVSQGIGLQGVALKQKNSLLPNLRSNKFEGQSNSVNPGVLLLGAGCEAMLLPELKAVANANYVRFADTHSLEAFINQAPLHKQVGIDAGLGVLYRPFLNNNALLAAGVTAFAPMAGFVDIYERSSTLYAGFVSLIFTY
jgi:hypothetical protein